MGARERKDVVPTLDDSIRIYIEKGYDDGKFINKEVCH